MAVATCHRRSIFTEVQNEKASRPSRRRRNGDRAAAGWAGSGRSLRDGVAESRRADSLEYENEEPWLSANP